MKRADKSGARFALIIGENELQDNCVIIKDLQGNAEQKNVKIDELVAVLATYF